MTVQVVAVSPSPIETRIDEALGEAGAAVRYWEDHYPDADPDKIVHACDEAGAGVVCLGPGLPLELALELAEAFERERPECGVLLLTEPSGNVWKAALRAGVRDVVSPDASPAALAEALHAVLAVADRRRATTLQAQHSADMAVASRVITVLSPKGGAGKTTVATNLAVGLAMSAPGRVALVDLDLQFGDVGSALQLTPEHTMADVARAPRDFDATMLKVFLTPHGSGVFTLCAPDTPAEAEDVSPAQATNALHLLRAEFQFVVVDTGAGVDEFTLAAVEASTDIVLVGSTDVPSVRSLRKELDVLERLGMLGRTRHLVLNRSDAKVGMDAAHIEEVLGMAIDVYMPSSSLVPLSTNEGRPVLEGDPRTPVGRALSQLVARIAPSEAEVVAPRGKFLRRSRTS